ncbi:MAG: UDP-N-acetylmuramoyl-L-alanyl-D-glutamate--2,6-diaminopimelate ligase [Candidatus Portnoybacteria bacterium]|nr:UDP-N-acetylmuramoyl-L-alanyl-D-glutamate--2,6-diaminopimelate ligase [Candidatus Portnoybacteria bacterium]
MKSFIKKFIPEWFIGWYHLALAYLGASIYRFPSGKLIVIGVTGTKGKTTTCNLIAQILNYCGLKTGMATTVNFRIGNEEWINEYKQTMLGRFKLQKLLRRMVKADCKYAVIETSSEGILQHRHRLINYRIAVFTNLSFEHIERHGSFENYRATKLKLFEKVAQRKDGIGVYNLDDENVERFLAVPIRRRYGYCAECRTSGYRVAMLENKHRIYDIKVLSGKTIFVFDGEKFELPLIGEFNVHNAAAAICVALSQGLKIEQIKRALALAKTVPGRMEIIDEEQDFTAIVDYAHEPVSLESVLKTVKIFKPKRIIVVFGSAGSGRDKWRRPAMGEVADKYTDIVIVTTDDSGDERPGKIIDEILTGVMKNKERILKKNVFKIVDRRKAIRTAVDLAQPGDLILFAGKGGETWMNVKNGKKIPWDESAIVREEIRNKMTDIPVIKI